MSGTDNGPVTLAVEIERTGDPEINLMCALHDVIEHYREHEALDRASIERAVRWLGDKNDV